MHVNRNEIPAKIDVPGAVARQATEFGDASGEGTLGGEYFTLGAGTDIAPLLKGLEDDACQAPHWGYMVVGRARRDLHRRHRRDVLGAATSSTGRPATACACSRTPRSCCSARRASTAR